MVLKRQTIRPWYTAHSSCTRADGARRQAANVSADAATTISAVASPAVAIDGIEVALRAGHPTAAATAATLATPAEPVLSWARSDSLGSLARLAR